VPYGFKTKAVSLASREASVAYDTAYAALDNETVPDTDDYGHCRLCGETMYYCLDYTHSEDCPLSVVERHYDLFQDALKILDHELAQKMIEAGREAELLAHPLERFERAAFKAVTEDA